MFFDLMFRHVDTARPMRKLMIKHYHGSNLAPSLIKDPQVAEDNLGVISERYLINITLRDW